MTKRQFENLERGDTVYKSKGAFKDVPLEVVSKEGNMLYAITIDEVVVENEFGVKTVYPWEYPVRGLYQMFYLDHHFYD